MSIELKPVSLKRVMEVRMRKDGFVEYRIPSAHHRAYHDWRTMDFSKDVTTDNVQQMNPDYVVVVLPPEAQPSLAGLLPEPLATYYDRVSPEMKEIMEKASEEDLFATYLEMKMDQGQMAAQIIAAYKAIQKATMR